MTNGHYREVFPAGKLQQSVTSVTLVNNTAKTVDTTVPSGKRWILKSIRITNPDDVTRSCSIIKYKEAAKTNIVRSYLPPQNVTANENVGLPGHAPGTKNMGTFMGEEEVLDAGNVISVTWNAGGASSGGTDADGLVIEYLEVDV